MSIFLDSVVGKETWALSTIAWSCPSSQATVRQIILNSTALHPSQVKVHLGRGCLCIRLLHYHFALRVPLYLSFSLLDFGFKTSGTHWFGANLGMCSSMPQTLVLLLLHTRSHHFYQFLQNTWVDLQQGPNPHTGSRSRPCTTNSWCFFRRTGRKNNGGIS